MKTFLIVALILLISCEEPTNIIETNKPDKIESLQELKLVWSSPRKFKGFHIFHGCSYKISDEKLIVTKDISISAYNKFDGSLIWNVDLRNLITNSYSATRQKNFIIENSQIFYIDGSSAICIDLNNGSILWHTKLGNKLNLALKHNEQSQSQKSLFIAHRGNNSLEAKVFSISKQDGSIIWETNERLIEGNGYGYGSGSLVEAPSYNESNNTVYVGTKKGILSGSFIAIDANNGQKLWEKEFPTTLNIDIECDFPNLLDNNIANHNPIIIDDGILIKTGILINKLDFDGNILWRKLIHSNCDVGVTHGDLIFHDGYYYDYFLGQITTYIIKINPITGEIIWSNYLNQLDQSISTTLMFKYQFEGERIYKLTDNAILFGHNINSGQLEVKIRLPTRIDSVSGELILGNVYGGFAIEDNRLYYLGLNDLFCFEFEDIEFD